MHPILWRWSDGSGYATYSLLTALGYVAGLLWLRTQLHHHKAPPRQFWGMALTVVAGGLLGGKLGFFLVEAGGELDFWTLLAEWNTGWVFWTGLLSGMATGVGYKWWYNRHHRPRAYLPIADYCVAALAIGHVLGRLGCFFEGCCHGSPTALFWGIAFADPACSVDPRLLGVPLHPTQLIEVFAESAAALVMIAWSLPATRAGKLRYGTTFWGYVLFYSLMRFSVEFLRGDDRGMLVSAALSPSQWLSLAAGLGAAGALWYRGIKERDPKGRSLFLDGKK